MNRVDLSGSWELIGDERSIRVPIELPGDNYTALANAGIIPDPYFGQNELSCQWVGQSDWIFRRSFSLDADFIDSGNVYLHCDSLDTFGTVKINGKTAGESWNAFTPFRKTVTELLLPGENTIEVLIRSAENEAALREKRLDYPVPHSHYPVQSPHRNLVRKTQCHSGWDWGPCLMASGLYGDIYLQSVPGVRVDYFHGETLNREGRWLVNSTLEVFCYDPGERLLDISLSEEPDRGDELGKNPDLNFGIPKVSEKVNLKKGINTLSYSFPVEDPRLWWPNGFGGQPLYALKMELQGETLIQRIGFRTIEIKAESDDSGKSMVFSVNRREIFCKGANWIPLDALPGRKNDDRLEALLSDAVSANMNMLRVWGGGSYESERFYQACDEKGILLWQDFMFSCSCYPGHTDFLTEVEEEVRHQVKRLKFHPSLALWCGNNECLGALTWFKESQQNRDKYLVDYDRLYEGVIGKAVREIDPNRKWWSSSPSGGPADYSDCWHNDTRGDMHYWSVWHEGRPFEAYYDVTPRFCSEFGFQSFPSMDTLSSFVPAGQYNLTSPVMEHHQRHPRGNAVIIETLCRYFRFPEKFEHFLYLSQVQQALAMQTAIDYWRSSRPVCMGTLYWQLNDVWPAASWSSVEYSGRWKLLHYVIRRAYDPAAIAVFIKDDFLQVWGLNDLAGSIGGELELSYIDFQGRPVSVVQKNVTLNAESAVRMYTAELSGLPVQKDRGFFRARFRGGDIKRESSIFLTLPKECSIELPNIKFTADEEKDGRIRISLSTDKPAFFVSLDSGSIRGVFSDNCFPMFPGEEKTVVFTPGQGGSIEEFKSELTLNHLRKTYS